jgi:hypothetical protein
MSAMVDTSQAVSTAPLLIVPFGQNADASRPQVINPSGWVRNAKRAASGLEGRHMAALPEIGEQARTLAFSGLNSPPRWCGRMTSPRMTTTRAAPEATRRGFFVSVLHAPPLRRRADGIGRLVLCAALGSLPTHGIERTVDRAAFNDLLKA